jgi:ankyrin repeat protein
MNNYLEKYELLSEKDPDIVVGFNRLLDKIFKEKDIDVGFVEYLLTSPNLSSERQIYRNESIEYERLSFEEMLLNKASECNYVEIAKIIFTHSNVDKQYIDRSLDFALYIAASKGALDCVEYLSTSSDLERLANVNQIRSPLVTACEHGHLNVAKFLLESPNLKIKASLKELEDFYVFSHLCKIFEPSEPNYGKTLFKNEEEKRKIIENRLIVMKYLILEQKLQKNEDIDNYLNNSQNQTIKLLFDVQQLNSELSQSTTDEIIKRKPKL